MESEMEMNLMELKIEIAYNRVSGQLHRWFPTTPTAIPMAAETLAIAKPEAGAEQNSIEQGQQYLLLTIAPSLTSFNGGRTVILMVAQNSPTTLAAAEILSSSSMCVCYAMMTAWAVVAVSTQQQRRHGGSALMEARRGRSRGSVLHWLSHGSQRRFTAPATVTDRTSSFFLAVSG
ncbi:uncharacterized protein LOC110268983, partial [Arachis ipaensis]|uniref:uncharacterized protein LOC110268983 n=1 Tax=Arachis ipaensis TaxID=130454 RepID=UPI000A2B961B